MLLDVSGSNKAFELSAVPGGWTFTIDGVDQETARLLQDNAPELNLFYFVEQPGQPVRKNWFYDKDRPHISYNPASGLLVIQVDSKMEYNNEKV